MRRLRNRNFKTESISSIVDKLLREDDHSSTYAEDDQRGWYISIDVQSLVSKSISNHREIYREASKKMPRLASRSGIPTDIEVTQLGYEDISFFFPESDYPESDKNIIHNFADRLSRIVPKPNDEFYTDFGLVSYQFEYEQRGGNPGEMTSLR